MMQLNKCMPATGCCDTLTTEGSVRLFKALCDPSRATLLARLAERGTPATVTEAAGCCPVDLSVVSRHLAILRDAGVLASEKRGKEVFYRVRFASLAQSLHAIADAIAACCPTDDPPAGTRPTPDA